MTPLRTEQWADVWGAENAGIIFDLQAIADPGGDRIVFWDDSDNAAEFLTLGNGISITTNDLAIDHDAANNFVANEHIDHSGVSVTAGTGLTGGGTIAATRTVNVIGGDGITANANDIALTARAASTTVAVVVASGNIDLDFSSLTNRAIAATAATDSIVFNNGGVMEQIDFQDLGLRVVESTTTQTFALGDATTLQLLTGATNRAWTIPTNASVAFGIGTLIYLGSRDAGEVVVTAGGSVTLTSVFSNGTSTTDNILANGLGVLIKVGTNEWMLSGDLAD